MPIIGDRAALVVTPQLAIYYQATGSPFISSYREPRLQFRVTRICGVLFSVQKGLFFWSPLLLPACAGLFGLARSSHSARAFVLPAVLFLVANTYVIASWWDWQFGGSFGHRAFVDALPDLRDWSGSVLRVVRPESCAMARRHICGRHRDRIQPLSNVAVLERRDAHERHDMEPVSECLPQVALTPRRTVLITAFLAVAVALLGYLRDPRG